MLWISIERIREPQTCHCGASVEQTGRWFTRATTARESTAVGAG
ncbi:hypothetical protein [Streptomyces sp. KL116D]